MAAFRLLAQKLGVLEAFFVLAPTTGLRRGELLALRWEDVDLSSRQLRVRQALQRADGKLRIVEPKTACPGAQSSCPSSRSGTCASTASRRTPSV